MFSNYQLSENPKFKMTGTEFNEIVNTVTLEPKEASKLVKVALVVRTTTTNEVITGNNSIVCTSPIHPHEMGGYYSVTYTVRKIIEAMFPKVNFEDIKNTVLLPMGVYDIDNELHIYMNLVIGDNQKPTFQTLNTEFRHLEDLYKDFDLDKESHMVLCTLNLVNPK